MATINLGAIKFNWKGSYSGATAYVVDDVVESSGSSYICIAATTGNAPPNATYWEQMSSAGTNGTDLTSTLTTQGDIVYRDASGLARLGAGTAGQVLQTGGAGANPSWTTLSSDYVKITTINASSVTQIDMINGSNGLVFDGTYERYHLQILNYYSNGTPSELRFRITTDGGATFPSSGYIQNRFRSFYSGPTLQTTNETASIAQFHFGPQQASNQSQSFGDLYFSKPTISAYPNCNGFFWGAENNQSISGMVTGRYETTTTYNGIRVAQSGGGAFTAKFVWYGIKA